MNVIFKLHREPHVTLFDLHNTKLHFLKFDHFHAIFSKPSRLIWPMSFINPFYTVDLCDRQCDYSSVFFGCGLNIERGVVSYVLCRFFTATVTRTSPRCERLVLRSSREASALCLTAATREQSACALNSTAASGEVQLTFSTLAASYMHLYSNCRKLRNKTAACAQHAT